MMKNYTYKTQSERIIGNNVKYRASVLINLLYIN